ncbi:MAG: dienelactone hydrolase family protein [Proteobacteria bacterium]|nr:dienelactone hydrolase family protein [Pseudomonadota bacterium]
MGKTLKLTAADKHEFSAYRADPSGKPKGGLVVIQEIFGVNHHMRGVCDKFAASGYLAVAPALFDRAERGIEYGYQQADIEKGRAVMQKLDLDKALTDVKAALAVAKEGGKVGIVGYCWGGTVAWAAACRVDGLSAAASYYGGGVGNLVGEKPKCPVQFHFGDKDQSIPMDTVEKVKKAHPGQALYVYNAGHGFFCDERGSYDAEAAKLALSRTLEFFAKNVG